MCLLYLSRIKSLAVSEAHGAVEKMCLEDGTYSDLTILSEEDRRFPCHRIILAAKSPTSRAMMNIEIRDKEHYSNSVVGAFVDYFYEGEVSSEVLESNLYSLLETVKTQVENSAIISLAMENVGEMFSLSNLHKVGTLEATRIFVVENKKISISGTSVRSPPAS